MEIIDNYDESSIFKIMLNKKNAKNFILLSLSILLIVTIGCAKNSQPIKKPPIFNSSQWEPCSSILASSHATADKLAKTLFSREISLDQPILVASFVNIDNLQKSSSLGRIIPEQISSRLAEHGYKIIEVKLRQESVFIQKEQGEFLLSRELQSLGSTRDAYAVLVGTYAVSEYFIFISARIVRTKDNVVIAGCNYQLAHDIITKSLL